MSLSALTEDLTLFTPSLKTGDSYHRSNVQRYSRELARSGKLFCPHCYVSNGELQTVFFRSGGEFKRDHFFHSDHKIERKCPYSPMTEKHINAQSWVASYLSEQYPDALIKKEMQMRKHEEEHCRPDVCAILPDGSKIAYEIQVTKITEFEVKARTEKLQNNGCETVIWVFTEQSDSLLIQECLALKKQYHALISFEDDSSVSSVAITELEPVRQSLLQKLWNDYCLEQAEYWGTQSRFFDRDLYSQLPTDTLSNIDIQYIHDVLTIDDFNKKAPKIYQKKWSEAWCNRGISLFNSCRFKESIVAYNRAAEISPDYHEAWYYRGVSLANLGRLEAAIASFDKALEVKPDDHESWFARGNVLRTLGRVEEAIASYDNAVEFNPSYNRAWLGRGFTLNGLGKIEEARTSWDNAIES